MQLEDYFDFQRPDDIRIKGTRVGIETVLLAYLGGACPEEIQHTYPSTTLEQVYATITYYLANRDAIQAYLDDYLAYCEETRRQADENPPERVRRLLDLRDKEARGAGRLVGVR